MKFLTTIQLWFFLKFAALLDYAREKDWWKQYLANKAEAEWVLLQQNAHTQFSEAELPFAKALVDNQVAHIRMNQDSMSASPSFPPAIQMKIAIEVIKGILPIRHLVGMQPINGPAALVHLMKISVLSKEELTSRSGLQGPHLRLEVVSQTVGAKSRKLDATWQVETMQNMAISHPEINFEAEVAQAMGSVISHQILDEVINDLMALADTIEVYEPPEEFPVFMGDRHAMVGILVNKAANEIARKTRRGPGNFIVAAPLMISILQSASKSVFAPATRLPGEKTIFGNLMFVGTLNGTIKVYSTVTTDLGSKILVGYKGGNGETDTGYVYSPYVPLMPTGTLMDPETFTPKISFMTRYAKATFTGSERNPVSSGEYYAVVDCTALVEKGFM